jgi:polar amino acid transport system substrate-binding protein
MRRRINSPAASAVLLMIVLSTVSGCATNSPRVRPEAQAPAAPSAAVKTELAPTGALRLAVFTGNPLIGSRNDATGEITGTTVSLGRALAERAGVPLQLIEYNSIAKLVEAAGANAWDATVIGVDLARRNAIDYAPPHLAVDITYLVAPGSHLQSVAEADRPGVRIAAARASVPAIVLLRSLQKATFVQTETEESAFELLKTGKVQAVAQNRALLLVQAQRLPGSRVLDDRLLSAELAFALPKGRAAALAYVSEFVEEAKASGLVRQAINSAGLFGVNVAPAAR